MDNLTKCQPATICLLATILAGAFAASSQAQTSDKIGVYNIRLDDPSVTKDQEYGKPIVFLLRTPGRSPKHFHARLFRETVNTLKTYRADSRGCIQYQTVVLPVTVSSSVQMRAFDDPAWLHPAGDGFEAQEYTIVFETGDQPSDSIISIHKTEIENYFRYAVSIKLVPPESLKHAVEQTVKKADALLNQSRVNFQKITSSTCWSINSVQTTALPIRVQDGIQKVADLTPCKASPISAFVGEM
jgi:hypothetical protein